MDPLLKPDLNFDFNEFDATLQRYLDETQKDVNLVVAEKAFELAGGYGNSNPGALQLTEHANAGKIGQELAATVETTQKTTRSGKVRTVQKRSFGSDDQTRKTLAARIVNARRVAQGDNPIWGAELRKEATKLTNARIKSVNFIRSGWVGAIRDLASRVRRSGSSSIKEKGQTKGHAVVSGGWSPSVEIINTALNPKSGGNSRMVAVAQRGLAKAVVSVTRSMERYLERRMQKIADKHNAR